MAGQHARLRPVLGLVAALLVTLGTSGAAPHATTAAQAWDGSFDLYRSGTFTTQQTWLWCTAADIQIIRNIVNGERDHSRSSQQRYFEWMREHNRYDLPLKDGVDPAGWTAGMRHFVDDRYRLVSSASFDSALRSAVQRMRSTNLPVALAVMHGNHGWVLTGFSATADPATTKDFTVTSVRVVGPLWGLQSRSYGYDMRPGTSLTTKQLRGFFIPWRYDPTRMIWEGSYVSIQPVPPPKPQIAKNALPVLPTGSGAGASPSPAASPVASASLSPTAVPRPEPAAPDTAPAADLLSSPLGALIVIAVLGAGIVMTAGILVRRRPPHPVR